MLDGGLEIGAWLRFDGGGITDARPEGGGTEGVFDSMLPVRIDSGPGARLDGGADGGGIVPRLEVGIVRRLEGGLESGDTSPPRGPPLLSFALISGSSPDH